MGLNIKRRISAWLLLLVYLPIMVAMSLHIHADDGLVDTECVQCAHHVHHNGHFNVYSYNAHDCVLCQFATLPYVAATVVAIAVIVCANRIAYAYTPTGYSLGVCNTKSTRAPPTLF